MLRLSGLGLPLASRMKKSAGVEELLMRVAKVAGRKLTWWQYDRSAREWMPFALQRLAIKPPPSQPSQGRTHFPPFKGGFKPVSASSRS